MNMKRVQLTLKSKSERGFTLIEILMVILLIAILAVVAITQYVDFTRDTREATIKENLAILRKGIATMYGTQRARCGITDDRYPHIEDVNANDITFNFVDGNVTVFDAATGDTESSGCDTAAEIDGTGVVRYPMVTKEADRKFVAKTIPINPYVLPGQGVTDAQMRTVFACVGDRNGNLQEDGCNQSAGFTCDGVLNYSAGLIDAYGWCYNPRNGEIWANTGLSNGNGNGVEWKF